MQHTPGPWVLWGRSDPSQIVATKDGPFVAQTLGGNDEGNACMIAAAPHMAAALDLIVRRLQASIDDGSRPDQWSMEELVRKATAALPEGWIVGGMDDTVQWIAADPSIDATHSTTT